MGDFEALFEQDIFKDEIEKIKTIGETFMAASGLNLKVGAFVCLLRVTVGAP